MELRDTSDKINVENAFLSASIFRDVNLSGTVFEDVNLSGCQFQDVNLSSVAIRDACLEGMRINGIFVTDMLASFEGST